MSSVSDLRGIYFNLCMKYVIENNESSDILLRLKGMEKHIDPKIVNDIIKKTLRVMHINNKNELIKYYRFVEYYISGGRVNDIEVSDVVLNYKFGRNGSGCLKFEYPSDLLLREESNNSEIVIYLRLIDIYSYSLHNRRQMIEHFMNNLTSELCINKSIILYYLLDFRGTDDLSQGLIFIDMSYLSLLSNGVINLSKETYEILYDKLFQSYVKLFSQKVPYECALTVVEFLFPSFNHL